MQLYSFLDDLDLYGEQPRQEQQQQQQQQQQPSATQPSRNQLPGGGGGVYGTTTPAAASPGPRPVQTQQSSSHESILLAGSIQSLERRLASLEERVASATARLSATEEESRTSKEANAGCTWLPWCIVCFLVLFIFFTWVRSSASPTSIGPFTTLEHRHPYPLMLASGGGGAGGGNEFAKSAGPGDPISTTPVFFSARPPASFVSSPMLPFSSSGNVS